MTKQERMRRKRQRRLKRKLGLLLPIGAVALLIIGLTAGGIILSLNQTKKKPGEEGQGARSAQNTGLAGEDAGNTADAGDVQKQSSPDIQNTPEEPDMTAGADTGKNGENGSQPADPENPEAEQGPGEDTAADEPDDGQPVQDEDGVMTFAEVKDALTSEVIKNDKYLSLENPDFETARQMLLKADTQDLSQEDRDLYDILMDHMEIEAEGFQYRNNEAFEGVRLCDVEEGYAYYDYLLRKLSGTSLDTDEMRRLLSEELNGNRNNMNILEAADPSLKASYDAYIKNTLPAEYIFDNAASDSDPLKKAAISEGVRNGWYEFGLIRAYQLDETLPQNMKDYLIAYTRVSYALYGVLDISVHNGGQGPEFASELANQFLGGDVPGLADKMYDDVIKNRGRYAAAAIGYLRLGLIEATLRANIPDYSEDTLFSFLFDRGPADFRVYESWIGLGAQ
ncbi:MAG: hypothetical protein IKN57_13425 [Parasporobacterium sp.]|nr:hypothetical protein [Parasporobacterium sp.]